MGGGVGVERERERGRKSVNNLSIVLLHVLL